MAGDADLVLVGGRIFTSDEGRPWAKALAVRGDRLVAVGTDAAAESWTGRRTRRGDLGGRVVLPGFIDAHTHISSAAGERSWTSLEGCRDLAEAVARLARAAAKAPAGARVVGIGWDESAWPERRYLDRADLDGVATDRPVVAVRRDRHMASLNSRALGEAAPFAGARGFEADPAGRPTGILKEDAFHAYGEILRPSDDAVVRGLRVMTRRAHALGITSIHDVVDAQGLRAYQGARREGGLRLRVTAMPRDPLLPHLVRGGLMTGLGDPRLRLGAVKVFSDGSLGSFTAALDDPYEGRPGDRGMLIHPPEELRSLLGKAHEAGFQTATHAIGDAAIRGVLDALEAATEGAPRKDPRHRIEHFELPDDEMLRRARSSGAIACCQPNFIGWCSGPGGMYEARLGRLRASGNTPLRRILRAGIPLCFGSDGMPYGPLHGIHWAVNGFFEDQRISPEEAVRAYTLGGAHASFEEDLKGSLAPGKLADFVVLDGDPFREPGRIERVRVRETWIGGERVHPLRGNP